MHINYDRVFFLRNSGKKIICLEILRLHGEQLIKLIISCEQRFLLVFALSSPIRCVYRKCVRILIRRSLVHSICILNHQVLVIFSPFA